MRGGAGGGGQGMNKERGAGEAISAVEMWVQVTGGEVRGENKAREEAEEERTEIKNWTESHSDPANHVNLLTSYHD